MASRRTFLRGAGLGAGAVLFAPLLRLAHAQSASPRRFVIFLEGNGTEPEALYPPRTRSGLEALAGDSVSGNRDYGHDEPITTMSAGLAQGRALPSLGTDASGVSLEDKAALVLGLSGKITGGGHTTGFGALSAARAHSGVAPSETIDHHLGQLDAVRSGAPFDAVRVGMAEQGTRLNYQSCAFGRRKPAPIVVDPTAAFNSLFGSVAAGAGLRTFERRGQLLDFAREDARRTLETFRGSLRERAKVEAYLASLEGMVARRETVAGLGDRLAAVKPAEPTESPLYTSGAPLERLEAQVDIATAALLGGLTNVVVVSLGTGGGHWSLEYPTLAELYPEGIIGGHDMRHSAGGQAPDAPYRYLLHEVTQRQVAQMARMARTLHATPEMNADGTMLEHTVMVYMSDNGEKHHSNAEEWPVLLIGGQRLGFRTDGRSVAYPRYGHERNRQVSNLFNTLGHAAGEDLNDFGGEGTQRIAEGPLPELWG